MNGIVKVASYYGVAINGNLFDCRWRADGGSKEYPFYKARIGERKKETSLKTTLLLGVWKLENRDRRPNSPDGRIGLYDEVKCSSFKEKEEDPVC